MVATPSYYMNKATMTALLVESQTRIRERSIVRALTQASIARQLDEAASEAARRRWTDSIHPAMRLPNRGEC